MFIHLGKCISDFQDKLKMMSQFHLYHTSFPPSHPNPPPYPHLPTRPPRVLLVYNRDHSNSVSFTVHILSCIRFYCIDSLRYRFMLANQTRYSSTTICSHTSFEVCVKKKKQFAFNLRQPLNRYNNQTWKLKLKYCKHNILTMRQINGLISTKTITKNLCFWFVFCIRSISVRRPKLTNCS